VCVCLCVWCVDVTMCVCLCDCVYACVYVFEIVYDMNGTLCAGTKIYTDILRERMAS
jgi:hypothetical protein